MIDISKALPSIYRQRKEEGIPGIMAIGKKNQSKRKNVEQKDRGKRKHVPINGNTHHGYGPHQ